MIGYQMVGTNNYDKALAFYDELLAELGAKRTMEVEGYFTAWGQSQSATHSTAFCVCHPENKKEASVGNGVMTAFIATDTQKVDALYAKAIELGATCEGKPGPRGEDGFYAGYCRDLDGNKFNFFCITKTGS
ncbi:MAG: glyoxalase [Robiginitomaculum sp.]|nr:MAG: glyoxalase [Robiginitomaculum sp.]